MSGALRELLEACRTGDVSRVKRLVDAANVNAKDLAGRKSSPLHFAAGQRLFELFIKGFGVWHWGPGRERKRVMMMGTMGAW